MVVAPGKNMYDMEELIDACKLSPKHLQLEPIPYDVDHPLVGHAMVPVSTALKQVRNNRTKLERRYQKIKMRNLFNRFLCFSVVLFVIGLVSYS